MPAKLYKLDLSPPARAAMMGCEVFNVPVEMIDFDIVKGENGSPEFSEQNPPQLIPVLEDGELAVHDSLAILTYLADTYGKDKDSLYPKDEEKRSEVDQKMFFDSGILFPGLRSIIYPVLVEGSKGPTEEQLKEIEEAYEFMEQFLSQSKYIAGDEMTIADIAAIADFTSLVHVLPLDANKFPKTQAWIEDMEKQPFCQKYNAPGTEQLAKLYKEKIES